jgi:hypothetical protein
MPAALRLAGGGRLAGARRMIGAARLDVTIPPGR